jgi:hypothetical protein
MPSTAKQDRAAAFSSTLSRSRRSNLHSNSRAARLPPPPLPPPAMIAWHCSRSCASCTTSPNIMTASSGSCLAHEQSWDLSRSGSPPGQTSGASCQGLGVVGGGSFLSSNTSTDSSGTSRVRVVSVVCSMPHFCNSTGGPQNLRWRLSWETRLLMGGLKLSTAASGNVPSATSATSATAMPASNGVMNLPLTSTTLAQNRLLPTTHRTWTGCPVSSTNRMSGVLIAQPNSDSCSFLSWDSLM